MISNSVLALARADGPVRHADEVPTVRPVAQDPRRLARAARRSRSRGRRAARLQEEVADDPADEVELVAGVAEPLAELDRDGGDVEERAGVLAGTVGHGARIPLRCARARALASSVDDPARARSGFAWALPNTLVGLLLGGAHVPAPADARRRDRLRPGAARDHVADAEAASHGDDGRVRRRLGTAARGAAARARAAPHPSVHGLGPLFGPVYLALAIVFGYRRHPMERSARRAAGEPD